MRGRLFSSDNSLPDEDMTELVDELAMGLHRTMGVKVYGCNRADIAELIAPYIADLSEEDRATIPWLVWDLLQDGAAELFG
jgi:hypothetical protein